MTIADLPLSADQIDAAWLGAALASRFPGVRVESIDLGESLWGTATKVLARVRYNGAGRDLGLPERLCIKGGFAAHRELMAYIYRIEARFYAELAAQLELEVPRCYFSASSADGLQSIVILEDLGAAGARFCRVQEPLNFEQAAANLDGQAMLHARWWEAPELDDPSGLGWVGPLDPMPDGVDGTYQRSRLVPETYAGLMQLPRGAAVPRQFHDRDRMAAAMQSLRAIDREGPRSLLHSDPHLGNMYFTRTGAAGFLDWQSLRIGHWAHDVTYFLVSALDLADRPRWERALLMHYLDRLRAHGVRSPPRFDEAWLAYRRQIIYGLFYWLVNPVEFQAEVNNCAVAPRFAMAALEHGTLGLLGV